MANLSLADSTYQTGGIDTRSTLDGTSAANFQQMNGAASADIAIETVLGDGPTLKGTAADLVARLAVHVNAAGKLLDLSAATKAVFPPTVGEGCTGVTSFTTNGVVFGAGVGALQATAQGAAGTVLHGNAGAPTFGAVVTADITDGNVTTAKIPDLGVTTAKIDNLSVTTGKIALLNITGVLIASAAVSAPKLSTATGSATGAGDTGFAVTMNDFSFFPSLTINTAGLANVKTQNLVDPGDTIGRLHIVDGGAGSTAVVRWRYVTASDDPTIWIAYDPLTGAIRATWCSDDPIPNNEPGVAVLGMVSLQFKAADILNLVTPLALALADVRIASRKLNLQHRAYRAMQVMTNDDAPSGWIFTNCKVVAGQLVKK